MLLLSSATANTSISVIVSFTTSTYCVTLGLNEGVNPSMSNLSDFKFVLELKFSVPC